MTRYLILGNSAAGLSAIDAIRQRDKDGPITVVSKEAAPAYSRVALPYLLSREKELSQVILQGPEYFKANKVKLIGGIGASGLDSQSKAIRLEDGRSLPYHTLLIPTGPPPPPAPAP